MHKVTQMQVRVAVVVAALVLGACHKQEPVRSAAWYQEHPAELAAQSKLCKANPGELAKTPNCVNAKQALFLNDSRKGAAQLKPIDWSQWNHAKDAAGKPAPAKSR